MKKISWLLLLFILLEIFSSCLKNEICSPVIIELQAGIYTLEEMDGIIDTIPSKLDLITLTGLSIEDDYLLFDATDIDVLSLPLNNSTNESSFILSIGETKDTIRFTYEKYLLFNSIKCGVAYTYTITGIDYSTNLLQDIILTKPEIDVISAENIQLVF